MSQIGIQSTSHEGEKSLKILAFEAIFELFDQTGYCFNFAPKGVLFPSLVKLAHFAVLLL